MMDPFMAALGGFDPFGMSGMGGMFGGAPMQPAQPDPFAQLTTAEEQMAETLTETGKTNPDRMRMERVINQVGGKFTGELAALNYLVQDFWMTTPGPVPPPNIPAPKKGPGMRPTLNNAQGAAGGMKGPGVGPAIGPGIGQGMGPNMGQGMGAGMMQGMGTPRGQAMANGGPYNPQTNLPVGQPAPAIPAAAGPMGMQPARPSGRRPVGMAGPAMAGRPGPGPRGQGFKPVGRQAGPPVVPAAGRPVGQPGGFTKTAAPMAGPPARKPVAQAGTPTRQQRIREKIQALRTKLNQLRSQTVNGKNPQLLGVQNQINGLVKLQKQAAPKPKRGRAQRPGKIEVITRAPTMLRQGTMPARHRNGVRKANVQPAPTTAGYDMFGLVNPALKTISPAKPKGMIGAGAPTHLAKMPANAKMSPSAEPTKAPVFGDVRYMNGHKYVYTDADGFDVPQWIKQAPGQANNQNQAQEGQAGQEAQGQGQQGANGNV